MIIMGFSNWTEIQTYHLRLWRKTVLYFHTYNERDESPWILVSACVSVGVCCTHTETKGRRQVSSPTCWGVSHLAWSSSVQLHWLLNVVQGASSPCPVPLLRFGIIDRNHTAKLLLSAGGLTLGSQCLYERPYQTEPPSQPLVCF